MVSPVIGQNPTRLKSSFVFLVLALICLPVAAQHSGAREIVLRDGKYTTCPELKDAVIRSVGYVGASEPELLKWAVSKPRPKITSKSELVRVQVQVEGQRVFCAEALDGPLEKQRAAVEAAMAWKFKKNRGEFKDYLMGVIEFRF
jgi:hypothetical protein